MKKLIYISIFLILLYACTNPFAPAESDKTVSMAGLTDQTSIEGVFKNFEYAYMYKDTLVYGNLLHDDYTFVFMNYDLENPNVTWRRHEDMQATYKLFKYTQDLDLKWYGDYFYDGDTIQGVATRIFSLRVGTNTASGTVRFFLLRDTISKIWKITKWIDESTP